MERFVIGIVFATGTALGALTYREYARWQHARVLKTIFGRIEEQHALRAAVQQGQQLGLYRMSDAARPTVN